MNCSFRNDPIADPDAILTTQIARKANASADAPGYSLRPVAPMAFAVDPRPKVVAEAVCARVHNAQSSIGSDAFSDRSPQCVNPTSIITSTPTTLATPSTSPVKLIAGKRTGGATQASTRQPRRAAAKLDQIALKKTWDGRKSTGRKDKMTEVEKFSAAVWHTASAQGLAISLNFGIRRESMLWTTANPKRRLMQNLNRHLSEAGFGALPYALAFELTPEAKGGRLHLHGAIETAGLSQSEIQQLSIALRRAASFAHGAIGGERQLDIGPLHNPGGWVDYSLKDMTRTARELGIQTTVMMNNPMRRLAKDYFERFREEVVTRVGNTLKSANEDRASHQKTKRNDTQGFTIHPVYARKRRSGERDRTLVGGAPQRTLHRPQPSLARIVKSHICSGRGQQQPSICAALLRKVMLAGPPLH